MFQKYPKWCLTCFHPSACQWVYESQEAFFLKIFHTSAWPYHDSRQYILYVLTELPVICYVVNNNCKKGIMVAWCSTVCQYANLGFEFLGNTINVICLCAQMDETYFEELSGLLNWVLSHFHHPTPNALTIRDTKLLPTVVILQKVVERRIVDFWKWLIWGYQPLCQQPLKFTLIPFANLNNMWIQDQIIRDSINHTTVAGSSSSSVIPILIDETFRFATIVFNL